MSGHLRILRAGPLTTIQDTGRSGYLSDGISASGPMDLGAYHRAGQLLNGDAGAALEFTTTGCAFVHTGLPTKAAFCGGHFSLKINDMRRDWDRAVVLEQGAHVEVSPGKAGNYGYMRVDKQLDVPLVLGSRATNMIVGLGGYAGRALAVEDALSLVPLADIETLSGSVSVDAHGPIRFIWGLHAEQFKTDTRAGFVENRFEISTRLNRMGIRLNDMSQTFADSRILSLVSDAVVPGDIQILGDGTPIVLMRDHQPTGGYPRIATVISADLDRLAQMRPGDEVRFEPVNVATAQAFLRSAR